MYVVPGLFVSLYTNSSLRGNWMKIATRDGRNIAQMKMNPHNYPDYLG
jgi:hypothetical protein